MKIENESLRQQKVSRELQRVLGELFQREAATFALRQMVTVTRVRVSPDLGVARVYLSVFPSSQTESVMAHIENVKSEIRYALGKQVRHQLRVVPELGFFVDDSLDYIDNIDRLLHGDK